MDEQTHNFFFIDLKYKIYFIFIHESECTLNTLFILASNKNFIIILTLIFFHMFVHLKTKRQQQQHKVLCQCIYTNI
jgi:hypothetical protein